MPSHISRDDAPKRVLVVEDNRLERLLIRHRLRGEPLSLHETEYGANAYALALEWRPDLVLLDLNLPDMHGYDLIRMLKHEPATRNIPVVVLSGESKTAEKVRALDLGAIDFITKPYDPVELCARIRSALRTKYLTDLLEQKAQLDPLTGLANRNALFDRFESECAMAARRGSPLSVLVADLDHFKLVNDQFGHSAGDAILGSAARVMRDVARRGDLVARYGGEEFVILAPDCDLQGGLRLAARVREAVSEMKVAYGNLTLQVTTSVGAVTINDPSEPLTFPETSLSVFKKADQALYSAKHSGRNAVHFWNHRISAPTRLDTLRISA